MVWSHCSYPKVKLVNNDYRKVLPRRPPLKVPRTRPPSVLFQNWWNFQNKIWWCLQTPVVRRISVSFHSMDFSPFFSSLFSKGLQVEANPWMGLRSSELLGPVPNGFLCHEYRCTDHMAAEEPWKRNLVETQQVFVNTTNISIFFYSFLKTEKPKVPPTRPPSVLFQILRNLGGSSRQHFPVDQIE